MKKRIVSVTIFLLTAVLCPPSSGAYESTYELIRWGNRGTDTFYCIDILDENWELYEELKAISCGKGLHFWSARNFMVNVLGADDLPPGFKFNWKVWSPSGYGGEGFEGRVVVGSGARVLQLYAVAKTNTGTSKTEVFLINREEEFQTLLQVGTTLPGTGPDNSWTFEMGDHNGDGILDLYALKKADAATDSTEVHILNGADNFRSFLMNAGTPLGPTGSDGQYRFKLGDFNEDGKNDLYVFSLSGNETGTTELHILNGADNFQSFLLHTGTILPETLDFDRWEFEIGDYDNDGIADIYVISKVANVTGTTEVHIMNSRDGFQTLLQIGTALPETGNDRSWVFETGDFNRDGYLDIYAIARSGTGSGTTEFHILNGADQFKTFLLQTATILGETGNDNSWEFFVR